MQKDAVLNSSAGLPSTNLFLVRFSIIVTIACELTQDFTNCIRLYTVRITRQRQSHCQRCSLPSPSWSHICPEPPPSASYPFGITNRRCRRCGLCTGSVPGQLVKSVFSLYDVFLASSGAAIMLAKDAGPRSEKAGGDEWLTDLGRDKSTWNMINKSCLFPTPKQAGLSPACLFHAFGQWT